MSLRFHEIAESNHRILNPFAQGKLDLVGEICGLSSASKVLDLCCGKAEMLAGWSVAHGVSGVGVDISEVFLDAARRRIDEVGVAERVRVVRDDAASWCRSDPDTYDVVSCIGATWIGGGLAGTIELLAPRVTPGGTTGIATGGTIVVGECYRSDPAAPRAGDAGLTPEAAAELATFPTLVEVLDTVEAAGWELVEMVLADHDDWDRYVAAQWKTVADHLRDHPDDPVADELRAWAAQGRRDYLAWQRRRLGWGVFVLRPARTVRGGRNVVATVAEVDDQSGGVVTEHAPARRYLFPERGDTLTTVASRVLPDDPDGGRTLLSWNLHLALRRTPVGEGDVLLGTDIVYTEPPT